MYDVPLRMEALPRVGVLVEMGAVEVGEAVPVAREVRRHPVEDHADAVPVQDVDEVHEVLRRAVARGRREVAGRLVAPRAVERVLGDRQQLDVREAHVADVLGELVRDLAVGKVRVAFGRGATSRGAPRRSRSARRARSRRGAPPSTRRRPSGSRATRRARRSRAAPRRRKRTDRPCRSRTRRGWRRCGTCRRVRARRRARSLPRCPIRRRASERMGVRVPAVELADAPTPAGHSAPTRRTRRRRPRAGSRASRRAAHASLP